MQLTKLLNHSILKSRWIYVITILLAIGLLLFFYFLQITFVYQIPFYSRAILVPTTVGIIVGILFGLTLQQYTKIKKNYDLKDNLENQKLLNKILIKSKETQGLLPFLEFVLNLILDTPFATLQRRAGVFLKQSDGKYHIAAHVNLGDDIIKSCAIKGIGAGECLCGLAIKSKETVYASHVDERHTIGFEGMHDHGHYSLPIMHNGEALGALVLYVESGHQHSKTEEDFLKSVTDILALVISKYQSEEKLRLSSETIASARHLTGIASWFIELPSGKVTWSDEIYKMLGYEPGSVPLNKHFLKKITFPADGGKVKEAIENAKRGIPFEFEVRYLDVNREIVYVMNNCTPFKDYKGGLNKLVGTVFNLTNIRKNEHILAEKEAFIKNIAASTPYALYLFDVVNNKILFSNQEFSNNVYDRIIKGVEKEGVGVFNSFFHPDDVQSFKDLTEEILLKGDRDFYSHSGRFAYDGKNYRWIHQRFRPFKRDENGKITQVLMATIDITKQKETEEKEKKLNIKLLSQNKKLKKVNNELDKFIYSASHDLRAPLASILGLVNLWEMEKTQSNQAIYVDGVRKSVTKLDEFIRDIIDFAKNASSNVTPSSVNIENMVYDMFAQLKNIFPDKSVKLTLKDFIKDSVSTDAARLKVVLRNVLINSIAYSAKSQNSYVKCTIKRGDGKVHVSFIDNGMGIEKNHLNKIFNMFYRGTVQSTGSGLGLYIAKENIMALGGTINVLSEAGKGTIVDVEFPELKIMLPIH